MQSRVNNQLRWTHQFKQHRGMAPPQRPLICPQQGFAIRLVPPIVARIALIAKWPVERFPRKTSIFGQKSLTAASSGYLSKQYGHETRARRQSRRCCHSRPWGTESERDN